MDDEDSPFQAFLALSDWLWHTTQKTSGLTPEALVDHLFDYFTTAFSIGPQTARETLLADYLQSGARARPKVLQTLLTRQVLANAGAAGPVADTVRPLAGRQARHVSADAADECLLTINGLTV